MNGFNKFLAAAFLSAAMLFSSAVQAMEIRQFDKMADPDLNHQGAGPQAPPLTPVFKTRS
jgi:hypothetical protein